MSKTCNYLLINGQVELKKMSNKDDCDSWHQRRDEKFYLKTCADVHAISLIRRCVNAAYLFGKHVIQLAFEFYGAIKNIFDEIAIKRYPQNQKGFISK